MCVRTVDGKNPAPVDMVNVQLFSRFCTSKVVQEAGVLPSTVSLEFACWMLETSSKYILPNGGLPLQKKKQITFNKSKITTCPKLLECESLGISSSEGTISICATLTTNIAVQETSCAPQIGLVERITSPLSRTKSVFWCALCVKYFLGVQVNTEQSGVIPFSLQNMSGF